MLVHVTCFRAKSGLKAGPYAEAERMKGSPFSTMKDALEECTAHDDHGHGVRATFPKR